MTAWRIEPAQAFSQYRGLWDDVNAAHGNHLLLNSTFVEALIESFARPSTVLAVTDTGDPALLLIEPGGYGFWNTFQPSQAPIGLALFSAPARAEEQIRALLRALPRLSLGIGIRQQDSEFTTLGSGDSAAQFEQLSYIDTGRITLRNGFGEYWAARPRDLRENLARRRRRLAREGQELRLSELRELHQVGDAIRDYADMEQRSWKAAHNTAVDVEGAQGRFYTSLLRRFCERGEGVAYQLRFNDKLVASQLCIERENDMSISLKITYDEASRRHSPGFLLQEEIIRRLYETRRVRTIEFYGRATDEWTRKWTDEIRPVSHFNVYRNRGVRAIYRLGRSQMKFIKSLSRGQAESSNGRQD